MTTDYALTRSRRRTVAIYIKDGGVEVRAPLKMPKRDIDEFVASKARWITERLAQSRLNAERREEFCSRFGESKARLTDEYKRRARQLIPERVRHYAAIMGVSPSAVKINGAKTRWGSCSAKKSLNFSWRLAMADAAALDYVVVHELAHIKEMNHSARFWAVVAGALPDYKERQKRLKDLQRRLSEEDWD